NGSATDYPLPSACAGGRMCSGTLPGGTVSKMKNITTSVLHGVSTKNREGKQVLFHSGPGRAGDKNEVLF
ncbi:hypothetical protein ACN1Q7_005051, partial [Escherichia coli]